MLNSTVRTSATDPLRIDAVEVGPAGGRLGLTFCPGKWGEGLYGARWQRDLDADIEAIVQWGAGDLVTLIEDHEFALLGVAGLRAAAQARGLAWHHLPIKDMVDRRCCRRARGRTGPSGPRRHFCAMVPSKAVKAVSAPRIKPGSLAERSNRGKESMQH